MCFFFFFFFFLGGGDFNACYTGEVVKQTDCLGVATGFGTKFMFFTTEDIPHAPGGGQNYRSFIVI